MNPGNLCPYCNKKAYPAESQLVKGQNYHIICYGKYTREEEAKKPKVFAIHEQIFCNPEENHKHKYPLAPVNGYVPSTTTPTPTTPPSKTSSQKNCTGCSSTLGESVKFCTNCGTKVL